MKKLLALMAAFGLMASLVAFANEEEHHDDATATKTEEHTKEKTTKTTKHDDSHAKKAKQKHGH